MKKSDTPPLNVASCDKPLRNESLCIIKVNNNRPMWHLRLRRPTYTVGPHVHNGVFYVLLLGCFRQPTFSCNLVRVWIVCPQHEKKTKNSKITNISSECYKFHVL